MQTQFLNLKLLIFIAILTVNSLIYANKIGPLAPQFTNLGHFHHKVTTKSQAAQQFFDQGMILFYGFEWGESIRSFREAARLDPQCAMCYWGIALAQGHIINAPIIGHEYADAKQAIDKAMSLISTQTPIEQDYIKALSMKFKHQPTLIAQKSNSPFSCHTSNVKQEGPSQSEIADYSDAMERLVNVYPEDNDAKNLYAYSLFNKINWEFWDSNYKINPLTPKIIAILKSSIAQQPQNIGGNHYFIHVIEQSPNPAQALASANLLTHLVPGSEHLVHMPAHIYFLTGRYHEASASNLQAIEAYKKYEKACLAQGFKPEINFLYFHNYDFLRTTAIIEGRKQLALEAAGHILKPPFDTWQKTDPSGLQWFIPIHYYVQAQFGLWNEIFKEPSPPVNHAYAHGMWHYVQGLAHVNTGNVKKAQFHLGQLKEIIGDGNTDDNLGDQGLSLLNIAQNVLAATIANQLGDEKETLSYLKKAADIQYHMGYHEPPDWYFPVNQALGDAFLKWGHPNDAINSYKKVLKQYPKNGWALYGLAQSYKQLGDEENANKTLEQFKEAWNHADITTPTRLFAK